MANLKLIYELENYLSKFVVPSRPENFKGFHYIGAGRSKLIYKDLKTNDVRSVMKEKLSVHQLAFKKQFAEYEYVWFSSSVFEIKSIPLYWLGSLTDEQLISLCPQIFGWSSEIDNWALSDGLCSIYARILEEKPSIILPTLKKWNKSSKPWLQRISLISLFYYTRQRKKYPRFNLVVSFIKPHFKSNDYFVQKAVGWTLRELYNAYPNQALAFLGNNLEKITSVAWYAASEKLKPAVKSRLLKKRKLLRKKV